MPYNTYPYELPPLPYAYDALEPYIDAETLYYHHDKHFQTYTDNLNAALTPYPALQRLTLEQLLTYPKLPEKDKTAILNNGGGVYNHRFYFAGLSPAGADNHHPTGALQAAIVRTYGSFENFKKQFHEMGTKVFGSGWTCLALTKGGRLSIMNLKDQQTVLPATPVLLADVWEHAYYLQYKNLRTDYLDNLWNILRFPVIN